jgi:hypothetical protein
MPTYDSSISRDASNDPLVPTPVSAEIIKEATHASALLTNARKVTMPAKTHRIPALSVLPQAYFVSGDTGMKQTTSADWENVTLTAEEIAVIVPVPEAYLDDSQVPIWNEVRPLIAESFGRLIDRAGLFDYDRPSTWSAGIVPTAKLVADDGFNVNGFVSAPSLRWRLIGLRSTADGIPIYAPPAGPQPGTLFGYALNESLNGGFDTAEATLIAGDWSKAIVGIRQDISFKVFTEGVISDASGNVVLNLMQQDSVALRATMRVAFATANPVTRLNETANTRYPFAVLQPSGAS